MNFSDRHHQQRTARLAMAIAATAEVLGQALIPEALQLMAEELASYPPDDVAAALKACRRELAGRLTLAAILQRVQAADGRPGKDEAWSMALAAADEFETVVLTEEIRAAMGASAPILAAGDKVGARMAFLSAYERLVSQARSAAKPVRWEVSMGFDPGRRALAIEEAVRRQLLPPARAEAYLADLRLAPVSGDGAALAGLVTHESRPASAQMREKLEEVRKAMAAHAAARAHALRKADQAVRVDCYLRKRKVRLALAEARR